MNWNKTNPDVFDILKEIQESETDKEGRTIKGAASVNLEGHIRIYQLVKDFIELHNDYLKVENDTTKKILEFNMDYVLDQLLCYRICSKDVIQELYKTKEQNNG